MVFIPLLFFKAFLSMASQRIESFILVLLILFLLTLPLGYLIIKAFRLFPKSSFFDRASLSFGIGLGAVIILSLWMVLVRFSAVLIFSEIVLIDLILFGYCWRKDLFFSVSESRKIENTYLKFLIWGVLGILFFYYSLVPLTTDLAIFRDYDLFAWGIQENSDFKLPIYGVTTYYPPGASLITALINLIIPQVHIPKIMLNLAYFFAFYLFILFYQIGNLGFNNKYLGLFFMLAWVISPVSRNFVTGGATIPGNLSAIFGLICLLLLLNYLKLLGKSYLLLAGILLGVSAISHVDTLLTFLWAILSLTISGLALNKNNRLKAGFVFISLAVISLLIASPYLAHAIEGKAELSKAWSDKTWENHSKGELHPKSLNEVMFFSGRWLFWLSLLGIPYIFWLLLKSRDWKKSVMLSLLLWPALMFASNNFTFLRIARPFVLFYAINIIMWFGIAIPMALIVGFGFEGIRKLIRNRKGMLILFFIILLGLTFIKVIDYETLNKENVFNRQQGFFMHSFAQRNSHYTQGDLDLIEWLKTYDIKGIILNPDGWIGFTVPIITKKRAVSIFLHHFYDSIAGISRVYQKTNEIKKVFEGVPADSEFLQKNNISLIFIPSSLSFNITLLEKYGTIQRKDGAKILATENISDLIHYEVEDFSEKPGKHYGYPWSIDVRTVEIRRCEKINLLLNKLEKDREHYVLYIKHLTFFLPLTFEIKAGDKSFEINKTTNKLTWSESSINLTQEELEKANWTIKIVGKSDGIDLKIKKYLPEIDWIEIE